MSNLLEILSKAPSEAWLGLLGVLIGASLSIIGVWLTNRSSIQQLKVQLQDKKATKTVEIKRQRLEELYILVDKWLSAMFSDYLKITLVMRGDIDYNQYHDQIIKEGNDRNVNFSRLEMIVDIYGHELQTSYHKLIEARSSVNELSARHKDGYRSGRSDGTKFIKPYEKAQLHLEELAEAFKKEIAELAKTA